MHRFDRSYFETLYAHDPDPWQFRSSPYERAKYIATLAALRHDRYSHALELGCAIGELTHMLAGVSGQLTAVDTSPTALDQARRTCAGLAHVHFIQAHVPDGAWEGRYDLIVLSEILYYLHPDELARLAGRLREYAAPGAEWIAVHWTGDTDYPLHADEALPLFMQAAGSCLHTRYVRADGYRMDSWESPGNGSP
jgi:cyclopropane fatty-acyl-phospholipid synthase-like methyltransferase